MKNLKMSIAIILFMAFSFTNAQHGHNHDHGKMEKNGKKMDKMDHGKMMNMNSDAKAEAILNAIKGQEKINQKNKILKSKSFKLDKDW